MVIVKFKKLDPDAVMPTKAHKTDAAWDLYCLEDYILMPNQRHIFGIGLACAIPVGYEMQIRPRSGLAAKFGIEVVNSPGTIDAPFREGIKVILKNGGEIPYCINKFDRIAQAVFAKLPDIEIEEVDELDETDRKGGLGSSGK
jgi:dUTP pyrophosphatase